MNDAPGHLALIKNTLLLVVCDLGALALFVMVVKEIISVAREGKFRIGGKEYDARIRPLASYSLLALHVISVLLMAGLATGFSLTILCKGYDLACGAYHGWHGGLSAYPDKE